MKKGYKKKVYNQQKPYVSLATRKRRKRYRLFFITIFLLLVIAVVLVILIQLKMKKNGIPSDLTDTAAISPLLDEQIIETDSDISKLDTTTLKASQDFSKKRPNVEELLSSGQYQLLFDYCGYQLKDKPHDFYYLKLYGLSAYQLASSALSESNKDIDLINGYLDIAIVNLKKARVLSDKDNLVLLEILLGKSYYAKGRFFMDSSIYHFHNALNLMATMKANASYISSNSRIIHYYLGSAYSEIGDYDNSIYYFTLLDGEEKNQLHIAVSYYKQSNFQKASEYISQVIAATNDTNLKISCLNWKAKIYFEEGMYDEAIAIYEQLISEYPHSPDPLYRIGLIYYEMNNKVKARAYFRSAADKEIPCPLAYEALLTMF